MVHNLSRRSLLGRGLALGMAGGGIGFADSLGLLSAMAQTNPASDYRALICLYLVGGNDTHNTVLATDTASWDSYQKIRGGSIALRRETLLPITHRNDRRLNTGRSFALHPRLQRAAELYRGGRLAVVANVGPLHAPLTKSQWLQRSLPVPASLFSHNDQESTWQTFGPEIQSAPGWGGRMADLLRSQNAVGQLTSISTSANRWQGALLGRPYHLGVDRLVQFDALGQKDWSPAARAAARAILTGPSGHLLESQIQSVRQSSLEIGELVQSRLLPVSELPPLPDTEAKGLADLFQSILQLMGAARALGVKRQVFYATMTGFDTHNDLLSDLDELYGRLDVGLGYLDDGLGTLGLRDSVTLFTASDFGRTLTSNGDGSDHGWGGHHFVLGGAVRGGEVFGRFPTVGVDTSDDVGAGRLLPQFSVEQYAATLARWMGLSTDQRHEILPRLRNFGSDIDLGFLA